MGCGVMNRRPGRVGVWGWEDGRVPDMKRCFENQQEVD